jgi:hypothetical protein
VVEQRDEHFVHERLLTSREAEKSRSRGAETSVGERARRRRKTVILSGAKDLAQPVPETRDPSLRSG